MNKRGLFARSRENSPRKFAVTVLWTMIGGTVGYRAVLTLATPSCAGRLALYNGRVPIPFSDYAAKVQDHLQHHYAIRVVTRDIPDPLTGDLNGAEIHIDYAVTPEQRLFLLGHLFGHTVQWNTNQGAFEIGRQYKPPVDEKLIPAVIAYEGEAASYGLTMLHDIGITTIDGWFSDYTACDQAYLLHFCCTGEKRDFHEFWSSDAPRVAPKPIPPFVPAKRVFRMDGVVI